MNPDPHCSGYCRDCDQVHSLPQGNSRAHALEVMEEFRTLRRLDYTRSDADADPKLSFDYLFAENRGHMFGVLECEDASGNQVFLRAFSSLRDGVRHIDGWVRPILDDRIWTEEVLPVQTTIKQLTKQIHAKHPESPQLRDERRNISQVLMSRLQDALVFTNFRGQRRHLRDAFIGSDTPPGGVGDCCGPRLLNHAAIHGLKPLGLSEFYWGAPTPNGQRVEGEFYACCKEKCQPILGFMLCGIDELS